LVGPDREARLANALRQNLRRRKAQRDARAAQPSDSLESDADPESEAS
jgi:hypothetical protein